MSFNDVLGHEKQIKFLKQALKQNKLSHSYLFVGNEGIGRKFVAIQFAKAINCINRNGDDSCDNCTSCRKIERNTHPDVIILEPSGQTLKVDQVREMQKDLSYRPFEGRQRICILTAADRMAPNMSNTLLKTLEEPPLHTLIILIANNERLVLPTIISRCQTIRFNPLPIPIVNHWLIKYKGLEEKEAKILATLSEGSLGRAIEIKEGMKTISREKLLNEFIRPKYLKIDCMRNILKLLTTNLEQRDNIILVLEVCKTFLRDMVFVKINKNEIINSDLLNDIKMASKNWDFRTILERMRLIHQTEVAIRRFANTSLAIEAMMISWNKI